MKKIIVLMIALSVMLVSLGGCFWGYEGHDRDGGYDRGGRHEDRGGGHDMGGDHEGRR